MHQVAARAGPEHGGVDAQVFGHVFQIHHRAVDHMAGDPGGIANQPLADHRFHPVAADHRIRLVTLALAVH
ncbi:hypothetical protein D3C86_2106930 [compost metagenome]